MEIRSCQRIEIIFFVLNRTLMSQNERTLLIVHGKTATSTRNKRQPISASVWTTGCRSLQTNNCIEFLPCNLTPIAWHFKLFPNLFDATNSHYFNESHIVFSYNWNFFGRYFNYSTTHYWRNFFPSILTITDVIFRLVFRWITATTHSVPNHLKVCCNVCVIYIFPLYCLKSTLSNRLNCKRS